MSSSRLPGKILRPIIGRPMLELQIERVMRSKKIERAIVATSTHTSDDVVEQFCSDRSIPCFRGSLEDVLDRYYRAARAFDAGQIVRLTGDCPLSDPSLIDEVIDHHLNGQYDYTSNVLELSYPDGLDVEVFKFAALERAFREAELPSHREHVTFYFVKNPDKFFLGSIRNCEPLSDLRWTVDYEEDFALVSKIYEALYKETPDFGMREVVTFLKRHPDIRTMNAKYRHGQGWISSFKKDAAWREKNLESKENY